ncbi:undecaprenyl-diphosphate phosphatase [Patescibacteria group bacterium]|nr:undecaprenyl-diphosphate phosphatase [Patescibacteria group bacterium]MBU1256456.1 undecaprenyl-diphosphate phosphatase [Patescibacteria group bacterium]MBU1457401.1 undecaprenyl-diphosphate phosphatase [Patescibacteria group bacterium]
MSPLHLTFFGILQGITEFLPVSSSGHLLFFRQLFGSYNQPLVTDIILHTGSLAAILYFFKDTLKKNFTKLIQPLLVSVIPASLVGLFFLDQVESLFNSPRFLFLSFSVTTIILLLFSQLKWQKTGIKNINSKKAFGVGLFQALAIVPGISRSASTIFAGKLMGLNSNTSFSFAFLMAIPAILGSMVLSLTKLNISSLNLQPNILLTIFLSSFISSLLALKILQKILKNKRLTNFAFYTAALAAISLALFI